MRNVLATLALAAVPALVLSACNGGTGSGTGASAIPNAPAASHSRIHHDDNGPQDLHAGGATFPAFAYNEGSQPVGLYTDSQPAPAPGSLFASYGGVGTIYYCLTGSGFGRKAFEANNGTATAACQPLGATPSGLGGRQDPLDFVGSDVAMASTECCAAGSTYYNGRETGSPKWGEPFEFPSIGGPISFGYRQKDFKNHEPILLSRWTYCAIANGTIGNWNDGAITADNGGSVTGGKSEPITFYYRSDGSGTSYLFTYHLNAACNGSFPSQYLSPPYGSPSRSAAWTHGFNQTWPGPTGMQASGSDFIGASGNPGVLAAIQGASFATGYIEGAWAASSGNPRVLQADLQDDAGTTFVDPTNAAKVTLALKAVTAANISYGMGSDGNSLGSKHPYCQLYIDPSHWNYPNQKTGAYPIAGISYLLFYGQNNGIHVADKTTLIKYIASSAANSIVKSLEYAPLNNGIHKAIIKALNGTSSHKACLQ